MLTFKWFVSGGNSGVVEVFVAEGIGPALDDNLVGNVPLLCRVLIPTLDADETEHEFNGSAKLEASPAGSDIMKLDRSIEGTGCCIVAGCLSWGGVNNISGACWKSPNKGMPCCIKFDLLETAKVFAGNYGQITNVDKCGW
ncbi:hypothetical protein OGAPHI_005283 [Ogataea philodendri]|uniref:Uncharacterized protein n=1 Tax=Ogataea philodendri TaxID=1378263 RepID=A0A9P8P2E3_9ASCO|nr:uncharacterized protein OGAPHI_005283 [Ogataea philodendri]KAH3663880.1 hypothetical protein OGAPHI_005283 [Ogataea philodendri]